MSSIHSSSLIACAVRALATLTLLCTASARADVVTDWNETAMGAVHSGKTTTAIYSRNMALVHAAVYDAVNAIEGRYAPYRLKLSPAPAASSEAAAAAAAHQVLGKLYPEQQARLDQAYAETLARIADGLSRRRARHWEGRSEHWR